MGITMTHSPPTSSGSMKFFIWNTKGANIANFIHKCDAFIKIHNPDMVSLLETKMVDHKHITKFLQFEAYLESSVVEKQEGIVVIWKEERLHI